MVTGDTMFLSSFLLIFLAEIADKTQLLVLTLSRRYSLPTLLIGMSVAALVLNGLSFAAAVGLHTSAALSDIRRIGAILFLLFGFHSLRPADSSIKEGRHLSIAWVSVALAFFIAELGDKTQLSTIALAAQNDEKAAVFCGSFLGLITSNLFAVTLGRHLLAHVREKTLHLLSAFLFFGFGSWMLFQLYVPTQTQVVIYCLLVFTLAYLYALWQKRRTRS